MVGNVCRKDHVEVVAANDPGIPLTSFPALLSDLFLADAHSIVVAGTHGKTTTSSLMAHILTEAGRDPSFLIGGVPLNFRQSWRLGRGPDFVVEGDEYDTAFFDKGSKFFHYRPRTVILTSVEYDHADIFPDEAAVKAVFRKFVSLIPPDGKLLVCAASPGAAGGGGRRALSRRDLRASGVGCLVDVRGRGAVEWRTHDPGDGARWGQDRRHRHESAGDLQPRESDGRRRGVSVAGPGCGDDRARRAPVSGHSPPSGGSRRCGRRHRGRRFRSPPDRDSRDPAGSQGAIWARQVDCGFRAPVGDQPAVGVSVRLRRRARRRGRGGPGAAVFAREGSGRRAPRRGSVGRGSAPRGYSRPRHCQRGRCRRSFGRAGGSGRHDRRDVVRGTTADCTTRCSTRWAIR